MFCMPLSAGLSHEYFFKKLVYQSKFNFCVIEYKNKKCLKVTDFWLTHFKHDICKELVEKFFKTE